MVGSVCVCSVVLVLCAMAAPVPRSFQRSVVGNHDLNLFILYSTLFVDVMLLFVSIGSDLWFLCG